MNQCTKCLEIKEILSNLGNCWQIMEFGVLIQNRSVIYSGIYTEFKYLPNCRQVLKYYTFKCVLNNNLF